MARVKLFHCHGTAFLFRWFGIPLALDVANAWRDPLAPYVGGTTYQVPGLNGQSFSTNGAVPNDPFPDMLDPNIWDAKRILYPASFFPLGMSIDYGVAEVVKAITDPLTCPPGTPFVLVGYSQGAAVMTSVVELLQDSSSSLHSRLPDFLGGVTFGNPRRKTNWRGPVGGTWSGVMTIDESNTGGHGSFPSTGPWKRMTNPPDTWVDFVAPGDVFSAIGDDRLGAGWVAGNDVALDLGRSQLLTYLTTGMIGDVLDALRYFFLDKGTVSNFLVDALNALTIAPGNGHTVYPLLPPPRSDGTYNVTTVTSGGQTYLKAAEPTAYQVALSYINSLANEWATVPIIVPPPAPKIPAWQSTLSAVGSPSLSAGWSATL